MYNMILARRKVWQEGKGAAVIYEHKATQIRPKNVQLFQKKLCSILNANGMMLPDLINCKCNDAQKECINCNLYLPVNICKGWAGTTRLLDVPLNCQSNSCRN